VLGVSLRTCLVTLSQHFVALEDVVLGGVVLEEVCAAAIPMLPASIAAAMNPIPVIRMRRILLVADEPRRAVAATFENGKSGKPFLAYCVSKKAALAPAGRRLAAPTPRRRAGETPVGRRCGLRRPRPGIRLAQLSRGCAMAQGRQMLTVTLDDKYTVEKGRVYLTGTQALVRLPLMQRQRDLAAGLNTGCFISGYRG